MDKELEILLECLPGEEDAGILNLKKDKFREYVNSVLNASYNLAYAGLRYGDLRMYFNGIILPKTLFFDILDFEKLSEYKNLRDFGRGFFESGETSGFKEVILSLKEYNHFLKEKIFEEYSKKQNLQL